MPLITIIGRGHSGTRMLSHTLYASGVYMGQTLNESGDKVPPDHLYEACRVLGKQVEYKGGLSWDFTALLSGPIDSEFEKLVGRYLEDVLTRDMTNKGWKLPETTLVFPWIVRMFPEAKYIYLIRDPRDCILGRHTTDDLRAFGVEYEQTEDERLRRAISWKYQYDIVNATPKPEQFFTLRFEDFILRQEETLSRLEDYLDLPLAKIVVRRDPVGRWKKDPGQNYFDFFKPAMVENDYDEF